MRELKTAMGLFIILLIFTGIIYPLTVTGIGQFLFPYQANGSLIKVDGQIHGSELIGQHFTSDRYLWGRPSATANYPYNTLASGGSNLSPTNPKLVLSVSEQVAKYAVYNTNNLPIPVDLVTSSASGLDPEISLAGAYFQMERIALAREVSPEEIRKVIDQFAKYPLVGFLGTARVNVLNINLALDKMNAGDK